MKHLSRRKLILTVPITLLCGVAILTGWTMLSLKRSGWQIEKQKQVLVDTQLPAFRAFLKPGMTRSDVEEELNRRSIPFESARDGSFVNAFIPLKRMPSSVWYCSFEDVGVRVVFDSPYQHALPGDRLRGVDIFGQWMDCM